MKTVKELIEKLTKLNPESEVTDQMTVIHFYLFAEMLDRKSPTKEKKTKITESPLFKNDDIYCIYLGKAKSCMCGCSGDYAYSSKHSEWSSKKRGYPLDKEEINDKKLRTRLTRFLNDPSEPEITENYIFTKIINSSQISIYIKKTI
jgi:hypothetical protein